jgi:outer membrane protein OmpA-like peptidoglycan-associated protein
VSRAHGRRLSVACTLLALAAACGPTPPPQEPSPPRDVVVLVPDPEDGAVGRVVVSNPAGTVELDGAGESTTVTVGQPPASATVMDDTTIQRLFGPVIAAQAPPARRFDLYFVTGSDTLTPESRALADEVVAVVRGRIAPEVTVIGHTDTTDTAAANVALGLKRASLIRDLLVTAGLDPSLVEVASHGESDLLVPTADNTPEAKNRRVEVTIR